MAVSYTHLDVYKRQLQYSSAYNNGEVLGDNYWKHGLYRNDQDFTSILYLDNFIREAVTVAVPEPETYALLLSGLVLIGFKGGVAKFKPK